MIMKTIVDQARDDYYQARGAETGAQAAIDAIQAAQDAIYRYQGSAALSAGISEALRVARAERNRLSREVNAAHYRYLDALAARY